MTSIRGGYLDSMRRMAAAMTSCNKCGTVACENLAKQVAHAWLKANKITDTTLTAGAVGSTCPSRSISENEAAGLILNKVYDTCNFGKGTLSSRADNQALGKIKSGWYGAVGNIRSSLAKGDCYGVNRHRDAAASAFTKALGCQNIHDGTVSGGSAGSGGSSTPKPTGTDTDCNNYGGAWLGGILDGWCVAVKKLTKGAEAGIQNPLTQYLPIMLIGMGFLAILMLAKK